MSVSIEKLDREAIPEVSVTIRNAGLAGAGGAGFPTYAKWERLDEVDYLLLNHQESEPNYYIDKWLGQEHADSFAQLFDALLEEALELVVVGAKHKHRDEWMGEFERATDATVYEPDELPFDPDSESGVVVAYTDDKYQFGMESVLLRKVADVVIGQDLPMDHGWIVQNTETTYRLYRLLQNGEPMTHKYVHVDGQVPRHRFLEVPIGTPAATLLNAAGRPSSDLGDEHVLVDGGPGWCFEIEHPPEVFGVRKRTNAVMVLEEETVRENTLGEEGRIQILNEHDWSGGHETAPTRIDPDYVRIPLIANPAFEGIVQRSRPIVEPGDQVDVGEMIARPDDDGISTVRHASVTGEVTAVTDSHIEIRRDDDQPSQQISTGHSGETERTIYSTWCSECGSYVAMPEPDEVVGLSDFVCEDCR